jgi:hypothetical protein
LDLNFNGIRDSDEPSAVTDTQFDVYVQCVRLISDKPVVAYLLANASSYSPSEPGHEFIVPCKGTAYIVPTDVNTIVRIGNESYKVEVGNVLKVKVKKGDVIRSAGKVVVVLSSLDTYHGCDEPIWAVSLIPKSEFGKVVIPPKFDMEGNQYACVTFSNGSVEIVNLTEKIQKIENDSVAYVIFDAYVKIGDRYKHRSFAFKVYPLSELGTRGVLFTIVSTSNENFVDLDTDYDGEFDKTVTLNEGDVFAGRGIFKSRYPVLAYGIWGSITSSLSAFSYKPVERGETPVVTTTLPITATPTTTITVTTNVSVTTTTTTTTQVLPTTTPSKPKDILSTIVDAIMGFVKQIQDALNNLLKMLSSFRLPTIALPKIF